MNSKEYIEKVKNFILLPNLYIQQQAVNFFAKNYTDELSIPDLILKSVSFYLGNNFRLLYHLPEFKLNKSHINSLKTIIREELFPEDLLINLCNSFINSDTDIEILESLLNNDVFMDSAINSHLRAAIATRKILFKKKPEHLFRMLEEFSEKNKGKHVDEFDYNYGIYICYALKQYDIEKELLEYFKKEFPNFDNSLLDTYMMYLASVTKLSKVANIILDSIDEKADFYNERVVEAVGKIKEPKILKQIKKQFFVRGNTFRIYTTSIFSYFPTEESENILIDLINKSEEKDIKTLLAIPLCEIFSQKGIPVIKEMVEKNEYDSMVTDLRKELLGTLLLYEDNDFHRYYDACKKIEYISNDTFQLFVPGASKKIGRNSPCPCGSGKKYKHCCLPKGSFIFLSQTFQHTHILDKLIDIAQGYGELILEVLFYTFLKFRKIKFLDEIYRKADMLQFIDDYFNKFSQDFLFIIEHLIFDYPALGEYTTLYEYFLKINKSKFGKDVFQCLKKWADSYFWLYEIVEINKSENKIKVKEWITDNEYIINNTTVINSCVKWDFIFARLLKINKQEYAFSSNYIILPPSYMTALRETLKPIFNLILNEPIERNPEILKKDLKLLKNLGIIIYHCIDSMEKKVTEEMESFHPEKIITRTNEEFIISTTEYKVKNYEKVKQFLDTNFPSEQNRKEIFYSWNANNPNLKYPNLNNFKPIKDEILNLGKIFLSNNRLTLETRSKERLSVLKSFVEKNLDANDIQFIDESFISWRDILKEAMDAEASAIPKDQEEISDIETPEKTKIIKEWKFRYYENLLNERIPALGNKTPYECVKTEDGKRKVIEWLKEFENKEMRFADNDTRIDFSFLYKKLGIKL